MSERLVEVNFLGRDQIIAKFDSNNWSLRVLGCQKLTKLIQDLNQKFGSDITTWTLPEGSEHESMLVRELILKAKNQWSYPYDQAELCHCRSVPTEIVDQAILAGAHSIAQIRRRTSASSACGTCQPDVEKILNCRLGLKSEK